MNHDTFTLRVQHKVIRKWLGIPFVTMALLSVVGCTTATNPTPTPNSVEQKESPSNSGATVSQSNAARSAKTYLDLAGFSRKGLIKQLAFEGYSESDAIYGVDSLNVNWSEQAARSAEAYLALSGFSRSGLIKQLMFEGYSREEAEFGASANGL